MKEHDIRHEALFKCYLKLSQQDVECCFGDDECQGIPYRKSPLSTHAFVSGRKSV